MLRLGCPQGLRRTRALDALFAHVLPPMPSNLLGS